MQKPDQRRIAALTSKGHWSDKTLCDYLRIQAQQTPDNLAAADQPTRQQLTETDPIRLTFSQLNMASDALAVDLLSRGVGYQDRIMIQMPNVVDLMVCYYAISKLGAIASPLPVQYGRHEISMLAGELSPDWFIGTDHFKGQCLADNGQFAVSMNKVFAMGADLGIRRIDRLNNVETDQLIAYREKHPISANDTFTVCWTSGTTGTPKGVPRTHNMWLASGQMTALGSGYVSGDILLNPFPMVNMSALGGFLFPAATLGCAVVLHHPIDVPIFLEQIQTEQVTFTIAPPALLNKLSKEPALWGAFDFPELRSIGSGSAPLSPEMIATFEQDYGVDIINIYGSNEGIALISSRDTIADPKLRAGLFPRSGGTHSPWRGELHDRVQSKVIDVDTGQELLAPESRGELCFSGATVFDGYLHSDRSDVFTDDGFFRTGDLVDICGDNGEFYRIAGRLKDIINRGGMKISPSELDTLLEGHDALSEAAVCAYPDETLGEKICVCIVPRSLDDPPSLDDICAYLTACGIAKFKLPERLQCVDALPRNPLGKVLRHELSDTVAPK